MTFSTLYMGVSITPDSTQRDDAPGLWWPHASFHKQASGALLGSIDHPEPCATREEADATALRLAKRHIRNELHQG